MLSSIKNQATQFIKQQHAIRTLRHASLTAPLTNNATVFPTHADSVHMQLILDWYRMAQGKAGDGGIPAHTNLLALARGKADYLAPSYPETSGYILCTLVAGHHHQLPTLARTEIDALLHYLLKTQSANGSITHYIRRDQGLAFDTGQVLTGLVAYHQLIERSDTLTGAITRAGDWMSQQIMDNGSYHPDCCWNGARAYYISATIGLIQAAIALDRKDWRMACARNAEWTYQLSTDAGECWLQRFSFEEGAYQNLHGIAYTIRGMIDLGRYLGEEKYIAKAQKFIDRLMASQGKSLHHPHAISGYYADNFRKHKPVVSPTGTCQTALCAYLLAELLGEARYQVFADQLVEYVKTLHIQNTNHPALDGTLTGSWPVTGPYMFGHTPNWAIKFFLDTLYVRGGMPALTLGG